MMFCPECGTKCVEKEFTTGGSCYDCPEGHTHWLYVDGAYRPLEFDDTCDICGFLASEEDEA